MIPLIFYVFTKNNYFYIVRTKLQMTRWHLYKHKYNFKSKSQNRQKIHQTQADEKLVSQNNRQKLKTFVAPLSSQLIHDKNVTTTHQKLIKKSLDFECKPQINGSLTRRSVTTTTYYTPFYCV